MRSLGSTTTVRVADLQRADDAAGLDPVGVVGLGGDGCLEVILQGAGVRGGQPDRGRDVASRSAAAGCQLLTAFGGIGEVRDSRRMSNSSASARRWSL